jgi:TrmH family RNA methyltransferase
VNIAEMITSSKNPKVQRIKRLQSKSKERQAEKEFVIEGVRLMEEAHSANWEFKQVFVTETLSGRGRKLVEVIQESGTKIDSVSSNVMRAISDTKNPQGIAAVIGLKTLPLPDQLNFVLILDKLRDPGNLGTILRTSVAANVQAVFLTPGSVDVLSPKVLRAGMGAQFRIPILPENWIEIDNLLMGANLHVYFATSAGGDSYYAADFKRPLALIIGGEAEGASDRALQDADSKITIPMPGGGESLNAAVAAGILLFEIARQRENNQ